MLEKSIAWHLKKHKRDEERDQRNFEVIALEVHVQVLFQSLDARIAEIDAVDEGEEVERNERRQEMQVTLSRHSARMIRSTEVTVMTVDEVSEVIISFSVALTIFTPFFSVSDFWPVSVTQGHGVVINGKDRCLGSATSKHERLGRGQSVESLGMDSTVRRGGGEWPCI